VFAVTTFCSITSPNLFILSLGKKQKHGAHKGVCCVEYEPVKLERKGLSPKSE